MSDVFVAPAASVQGEVELPGDKSISHRALLLAALGTEPTRIFNLALSADVASTAAAVERLGATVERHPDDATDVRVTGRSLRGLDVDGATIDAGNAGTLARLLTGILAGQYGTATIVGDASLSRRPMRRVLDPLSQMGARIDSAAGGTLPLVVHGAGVLRGIDYELPVASAQVQSALLLAGLFAETPTTVREPAVLRDHTERMLRRAGVQIERAGTSVTVHPVGELQLPDTTVPADLSGAAPLVAAAALLPESLLRVPTLLLNPGRTGFLDLLEKMGLRATTMHRTLLDGEPVGDLEVQHSNLRQVRVEWEDVPRMIDELPLVGLVAQFLRGETYVGGAAELRAKESDRVVTTVSALRGVGISAEEKPDGFVVHGSGTRPEGGTVHAEGDHRIAMLGGIAGLVSRKGVTVCGADCVDVSFPGFFDLLEALRH